MDQADAIRRYYATDRNLRIHEEIHAKHVVPRVDYVRWTLDTIDCTGAESSSISARAPAITTPIWFKTSPISRILRWICRRTCC